MHKIMRIGMALKFMAYLCLAIAIATIVPIEMNRNYITTIKEVSTSVKVFPTQTPALSPTPIPNQVITFSNGTNRISVYWTQMVSPIITVSGSQFHSSMYSQFLIYGVIQEVAHDISDTLKPDNLDYIALFLVVSSIIVLFVFILRSKIDPKNENIKTQKRSFFS